MYTPGQKCNLKKDLFNLLEFLQADRAQSV